MSDKAINYAIGGNATGAVDAFKQVVKAAEGLEHGLHALEGAFAFEKIKEAFSEVLKATNEAETGQRKFANTMAATGQSVDPDKFFEFAEALAKVSTFSAEDTVQAGVMLARFKLSQDQIEHMIPSIQDLAASMGTDLPSAADAVGRAVMVGSQGLRALNLGFTATQRTAFDAADSMNRMRMISERIQGTIGGTAAIMAGTAVGASKQFENALDDLYASFGKMIESPVADVFHKVTEAIGDLKGWIDRLNPAVKEVLGYFATGVGTIAAAVSAFVAMGGAVAMISGALPAIGTGMAAIGSALVAILVPMAAVAAGIGGAILLVGALRQAWDGDLGGMRSGLTSWVADVKYLWVELVDFIQGLWNKFTDFFSEKFIVYMGMIKGLSPEETGNILMASKQSSGGILDTSALKRDIQAAADAASEKFKGGLKEGGSVLEGVWTELKGTFGAGADTIREALKGLGLDFSKLLGDAQGSGIAPRDGKGGGLDQDGKKGKDPYSLADLNSQAPFAKQNKLASEGAAGNLSSEMGGGVAGAQAAAKFMASMEKAFNLSEKVVEGIGLAADGSSEDMKSLAAAMKGMSDGAAQELITLANGNSGDLQRAAEAMHGFSQEGIDALSKASGGDLDTMVQMAQGLNASWTAAMASANEAAERIKTSMDSTGVATDSGGGDSGSGKDVTTTDSLAKAGTKALGGMGTGGAIASAAVQGGEAGGPMGAVAGGVVGILMQTKGFQQIVKELTNILAPLVKAFEPVMAAVEPFMSIIELVINVFSSLMKVLNPFLYLIQLIGDVIEMVMTGIAMVYNGLLEGVAEVFDVLSQILPWGAGDAAGAVRDGIRGAEVNTDYSQNSRATSDNTSAVKDNTAVIQAALTNAPQGWVVAADRYRSIVAGLGDPVNGLAGAIGNLGNGGSSGGNPALAALFARANSTTPPQLGGVGLDSDMGGTPAAAPTVPHMNFMSSIKPGNTITANITAVDPKDMWSKLKAAAALDNFQTTGSSVASKNSPFVVPLSTAGLK